MNSMIPDEAVEAAVQRSWHLEITIDDVREILEAAAPYMLSHEREQTRLAHLDAVVNRDTADTLQQQLDRVERLAEHWSKLEQPFPYYAKRIRSAITGPNGAKERKHNGNNAHSD